MVVVVKPVVLVGYYLVLVVARPVEIIEVVKAVVEALFGRSRCDSSLVLRKCSKHYYYE